MINCQATKTEPAEVEVVSRGSGAIYHLCRDAAHRLEAYSLRPAEWYNLAVIHGPSEYYLHDDFYDETGRALQPKEEVVDAHLLPAPTLEDVADELEPLMDFARVHWAWDTSVVEAIRKHHPQAILRSIVRRAPRTRDLDGQNTLYFVCGKVLQATAGPWIRKQLAHSDPDAQLDIVWFAAECLPHDEALQVAMSALSQIEPRHIAGKCLVLAKFQDERVLDWIEKNVNQSVSGEWGDLAALSKVDWPRVFRWLESGRPLSLVALDALAACTGPRPNQRPLLQQASPHMPGRAPRDQIIGALKKCAAVDSVPRVKQRVQYVIDNLARICGLE